MLPRRIQLVFMLGVACLFAGCSQQGKRLNAPPQGDTDRPHELQEQFVYMVDKGLLYDSTISDIHFEPHSSELSGTGIRRLIRMGELMTEVGGTIHYDTAEGDSELVSQRLDIVREFLLAGGFDMQRINVRTGLSRGRGVSAERAILAAEQNSAPQGAAGAAPPAP